MRHAVSEGVGGIPVRMTTKVAISRLVRSVAVKRKARMPDFEQALLSTHHSSIHQRGRGDRSDSDGNRYPSVERQMRTQNGSLLI